MQMVFAVAASLLVHSAVFAAAEVASRSALGGKQPPTENPNLSVVLVGSPQAKITTPAKPKPMARKTTVASKSDRPKATRKETPSNSGSLGEFEPVTYSIPEYPEDSVRRREEGVVRLMIRVYESGLPAEVKVAKSSGYALLDDSALRAARNWRFRPGVSGWIEKSVRFRAQE
jgi:protein TonB